ncbi:protein GbcA [Pseudomonas sp. p99-361]|nr:protein GbcA [Pseudomonas sp. CAH-1]PPB18060.1 protein GbcA [Pseudomonas aeruginosa]PYC00423.1 protein GbcA [Pseudomonas sp. MB-090624]QDR66413.1 protein GbcA [Pseudomonas sp. BJP69]QEQ86160.1 protein GbcA [Pseudomonas putida]QKL00168.1 protein GbcA [Pseudomonas sp. NY5710]RRV05812.1 protein GbcA [Pseudomonas sp. p99-361]
MRKLNTTHIPACDIDVLIATRPVAQGLARRYSIRPCRPWIRFTTSSDAHSTAKQHAVFSTTALRHHHND